MPSGPGAHADAVARAERALRDGRAELAESRERAERDPGRLGPAGPVPADLRAAALAFRHRVGLAPVGVPPPPVRGASSEQADDEHFGDTSVLYRA